MARLRLTITEHMSIHTQTHIYTYSCDISLSSRCIHRDGSTPAVASRPSFDQPDTTPGHRRITRDVITAPDPLQSRQRFKIHIYNSMAVTLSYIHTRTCEPVKHDESLAWLSQLRRASGISSFSPLLRIYTYTRISIAGRIHTHIGRIAHACHNFLQPLEFSVLTRDIWLIDSPIERFSGGIPFGRLTEAPSLGIMSGDGGRSGRAPGGCVTRDNSEGQNSLARTDRLSPAAINVRHGLRPSGSSIPSRAA